MHKMWVTGLAASIGLAGWTNLVAADLSSAKRPVIAILADELFLGEAEGNLSGAGTLVIQSQTNSAASCMGQFTSSDARGGSGQMQCSDGATAIFQFQRLGLMRGYGAGSSSRGALSFTYGLSAAESESYLKLPPGRKLAHGGNKLELVAISPPQAGAPAKPAVAVAQVAAPAKPAVSVTQVAAAAKPAVAVTQVAASAKPAVAPPKDIAPDVLLTAVTAAVIAVFKQDSTLHVGNPMKVAELLETWIVPHFDFARMTHNAVARNWGLATPQQQKVLTAEFKTLLVRTYSVALSSYRDQVIEYKPLSATREATHVTVQSEVKQPGIERITMDYDMAKTPAGWKVYDIRITGISLVSTYRETFSSRVRDGGIDGLIKSLSDKNRQGGLKTVNIER